jgi:hypothetical protein
VGSEIYFPARAAILADPVVPVNWPDMEKAAQRIASFMETSFISVDVYTNGKEVFLGELTPTPGAAYYGSTMFRFMPEFDLALGKVWSCANRERAIPDPLIVREPPALLRERELLSGHTEASLRAQLREAIQQLEKVKR